MGPAFIWVPGADSPSVWKRRKGALDRKTLTPRKHFPDYADTILPSSLLIGNHSLVWTKFNSAACLLFTFTGVKWVWRGAALQRGFPSPERVWIWHWSISCDNIEQGAKKINQKSLGRYKLLLSAQAIDTFDCILLFTHRRSICVYAAVPATLLKTVWNDSLPQI